MLVDLVIRYHQAILTAYRRHDAAATSRLGEKLLGLFRDLDALLATRKEFLLGVWLADARRYGTTREEQNLCERAARELLTTWTDNQDDLVDYANRQWAGLVGTFYAHRWEIWLDALQTALRADRKVDVDATRARIREADRAWTRQHETHSDQPHGDTLAVSRRLFDRYSADALSLPAMETPVSR